VGPEDRPGYRPAGKEVDAAFGDYVLRNDFVVAVIANPDLQAGRSSSRWAAANVAGAVIDLTSARHGNDQLFCYYPAPPRQQPAAPQQYDAFVDEATRASQPTRQPQRSDLVRLALPPYDQRTGRPLTDGGSGLSCAITYELADDWHYLRVIIDYTNHSDKPLTMDLRNRALTAPGLTEGVSCGGRLYWRYDPWWHYGIGVLAEDHGFAADGRPLVDGVPDPVVQPGQTRRLVRRLMPGADALEMTAAGHDLLGTPQHPFTVTVSEGDALAVDAHVTIERLDGVHGIGSTNDRGQLITRLPAAPYKVIVTAPGREPMAKRITTDGPGSLAFTVPPPARLVAEITADGTALPCKIQVRGREDTPDPVFFADTGAARVRNLIYAVDGKATQVLAPGSYTLLATRGPEYTMLEQAFTVKPGAAARVSGDLQRVVDTSGWVSADFHNHSTVSGVTEKQYRADYQPHPAVDVTSFASQRGRVLNLLCEHIEFAPATEHNTVSSFAPHLEAMKAAHLMASCPGIGLTADRPDARMHQNVFPLPWRPWHLDGGARQRPQYTTQMRWLVDSWQLAPDAFIVMNQPPGAAPRPAPAVDAFDVRSLAPLVLGEAEPGRDSMITEWVAMLTAGYRLTGVLCSGAHTNYHGSGGFRNYVQSDTDDPAELDPLAISRSAAAGRVIMTTGPFLTVEARSFEAGDGAPPALPGDEIRTESGEVELHIRVQSPPWLQIERVQILINGASRPGMRFSRAYSPQRFQDGVLAVDQKVYVELEQDAHVLVVVDGSSPNLRADWRKHPRRRHTAAANPFFVDVGDDGYRPHSPFEDKVATRIEWLKPALAAYDAPPGRVRVHLRNEGDEDVRNTVRLETDPPEAGALTSIAEVPYAVAARAESSVDFELQLSREYIAAGLPIIPETATKRYLAVRVPRSAEGVGQRASSAAMQVDHFLAQIKPVEKAFDVAKALEDVTAYSLISRRAGALGKARIAIAGDFMLLAAEMADSRVTRGSTPWLGSCVEVFAATEGVPEISRIVLLPRVGAEAPAAFVVTDGAAAPLAGGEVFSRPRENGYELAAIIPLASLAVDPGSGRLLLELCAAAHSGDLGRRHRGTVFFSSAPETSHTRFGRMRLTAPVAADFELIEEIDATARAAGAVELRLRNLSDQTVTDTAAISVLPADAGSVSPTSVPFTLAAGEERTVQLTVNSDSDLGSVAVQVLRSPQGALLRAAAFPVRILGRRVEALPSVPQPAGIAGALSGQRLYRVYDNGVELAVLRLAAADNHILLAGRVKDPRLGRAPIVWEGSCVEVFGGSADSSRIGQVFLAPRASGEPAGAFRLRGGKVTSAGSVKLRILTTSDGYEIAAAIPFELLTFSGDEEILLLEVRVTTGIGGSDGGSGVRRGTLFGSPRAYESSAFYGALRYE
jgi:hypothetical protein